MHDAKAFFEQNTHIDALEAFIVDINGALRGKKIPRAGADDLFKSGVRMPLSTFAFDIFGQVVMSAGMISETGDNDGVCRPAANTLKPAPWLERPTAQVIMSMFDSRGKACFADPRQTLQNVLNLFAKKGWTPVVAVELEFYIIDGGLDERGNPQPPRYPRTGKRVRDTQALSIAEVEEFEKLLADMGDACKAQDIPADATISENGPGQYEINLLHHSDALLAADQALMMKRAVRGVARRHGMDATFMAKPYGNLSGSGMHVHFSILDKKGNNIFAGKDRKGTPALRHAIAGLMQSMPDFTAIFAPNYNSYRRFAPNSHAPTTVSWGYDNRMAAIRVPESGIAATRIEHRVGGADANPYLILAAILAGAYDGLTRQLDPGKPFSGDVYSSKAKRLPDTWQDSLAAFEKSKVVAKYFGANFKNMYLACKRQEKQHIEAQVSSLEYDAYLREV
ncbi:MAG: glutamine synthetase family protein [Micavibrio sp.]|nr:glutamine synthetase family protein [Micavibrio sp.]